jgi:hypothetical protein
MLFDYQEKQKIKKQIMELSEEEWVNIFYIIKNNNEQYTINKSGLLFDLINISNETLMKIKKYIESTK